MATLRSIVRIIKNEEIVNTLLVGYESGHGAPNKRNALDPYYGRRGKPCMKNEYLLNAPFKRYIDLSEEYFVVQFMIFI